MVVAALAGSSHCLTTNRSRWYLRCECDDAASFVVAALREPRITCGRYSEQGKIAEDVRLSCWKQPPDRGVV